MMHLLPLLLLLQAMSSVHTIPVIKQGEASNQLWCNPGHNTHDSGY